MITLYTMERDYPYGTLRSTNGCKVKVVLEEKSIDYQVVGVSTTLPFGAFVMDHPAFVSGDFDTHFLSKYFTGKSITSASKEEKEVAAWFAAKLINDHSTASMVVNASVESQWRKNRK